MLKSSTHVYNVYFVDTSRRILAAEQWHQDKKYLSTELQHLRKLSMQQVMEDIEADSPKPMRMDSRGEDDNHTGKLTVKPKPASAKSMPPRAESLLKSNSVRRPVGGHHVRHVATPDHREKSPQKDLTDASNESGVCLSDDVLQNESMQSDTNSSPISKLNSWNKSTKVLDKSYINNLKVCTILSVKKKYPILLLEQCARPKVYLILLLSTRHIHNFDKRIYLIWVILIIVFNVQKSGLLRLMYELTQYLCFCTGLIS